MNNYTISFLFDKNYHNILLVRKTKTIYKGLLNGIGGKIRPDETPRENAARKIVEETGIWEAPPLEWLGTLTLPNDCGDGQSCILYFYSGITDLTNIHTPAGKETLEIRDISILLPDNRWELAGDGDVEFFIRKAIENK